MGLKSYLKNFFQGSFGFLDQGLRLCGSLGFGGLQSLGLGVKFRVVHAR